MLGQLVPGGFLGRHDRDDTYHDTEDLDMDADGRVSFPVTMETV